MTALAIMAATPEGRDATHRVFRTKREADAHVARFSGAYPGAFSHTAVAAPSQHWLIDMAAKTVVIDAPPPPDFAAEDQAEVDALLLESGVMRALARALFQTVNDVRKLKGQSTITAAQFKAYLKGLMR